MRYFLMRSFKARRGSSGRPEAADVSRSTVARKVKNVQSLRERLSTMRSGTGWVHSNRWPGAKWVHCWQACISARHLGHWPSPSLRGSVCRSRCSGKRFDLEASRADAVPTIPRAFLLSPFRNRGTRADHIFCLSCGCPHVWFQSTPKQPWGSLRCRDAFLVHTDPFRHPRMTPWPQVGWSGSARRLRLHAGPVAYPLEFARTCRLNNASAPSQWFLRGRKQTRCPDGHAAGSLCLP